jgi:hypothetical protein
MNWLRKSLGVFALAAVLGSATTGCEDNESMLFIIGVMDIDRSDCLARGEGDAAIKANGVLDLSLRRGYTAALLLGSHLTQRGSREQLRTETARLVLQGAEVTLTDIRGTVIPLGSDTPNPYSTIGTGIVNPSGGNDAAYGVMFADIVPGGVQIPDQTVVSRVRAFGTTLGGAEIESNELIFQIQICHGCLIDYPATAADTTQAANRYLCETVASDSEQNAVEVTSCFPGQDSSVPCNACSPFNAACADPCQNCSVRATDTRCASIPGPAECP